MWPTVVVVLGFLATGVAFGPGRWPARQSAPGLCAATGAAETAGAEAPKRGRKPKAAPAVVAGAPTQTSESIFYPKAVDPGAPLDQSMSEDDLVYELFLRQISELNGLPGDTAAIDEDVDPLDAYSGTARSSALTPSSSKALGALLQTKQMVERPVRLTPDCPIEFVFKRRVVMGNFLSRRSATGGGGGLTVRLASGEEVAIDVSQIISSWDQLADEVPPTTAQQWAQVASEALTILGSMSPRKSDLQEFWQLVSQRSAALPVDSLDLGVYIFQERRFRSWITPYAEASESSVRALSAAQRYAAALLLFHDDFHFRRRPSRLLSQAEADALTDANELIIDYRATTDRPTPVNLSNHTYFNLAGEGSDTVLNHELMIDAEEILAVDKTSVPTGKIASVAGTPFDFRRPKPVGRDINQTNEQLANGSGYDHTFVLNPKKEIKKPVATLYEKTSRRKLQVFTDQPGLQLYTANFLDGSLNGKSGKPYLKRSSLCLETQHFPDSPNQPKFPNTILRPSQTYQTRTIYQFSVSNSAGE